MGRPLIPATQGSPAEPEEVQGRGHRAVWSCNGQWTRTVGGDAEGRLGGRRGRGGSAGTRGGRRGRGAGGGDAGGRRGPKRPEAGAGSASGVLAAGWRREGQRACLAVMPSAWGLSLGRRAGGWRCRAAWGSLTLTVDPGDWRARSRALRAGRRDGAAAPAKAGGSWRGREGLAAAAQDTRPRHLPPFPWGPGLSRPPARPRGGSAALSGLPSREGALLAFA